ncbi:MAG: hypothetical protein QGG54_08520 [Gammaproteobacteria bacterium]|jgi:hypothetical protein|nr:hypothetical protein [Gammaproteobacteria bacterium]MDP6653135.1 hypothetical protein [Gammaproteobacteria bacterium]
MFTPSLHRLAQLILAMATVRDLIRMHYQAVAAEFGPGHQH